MYVVLLFKLDQAYGRDASSLLDPHKGDERLALAVELVTSDPTWPRRGPEAVAFASAALERLRS